MAKHIRTYLNLLFCFIIHPIRLVLKPVTENKTSSGFWEIIKSQFRSELNFFAFFACVFFWHSKRCSIRILRPVYNLLWRKWLMVNEIIIRNKKSPEIRKRNLNVPLVQLKKWAIQGKRLDAYTIYVLCII